MAAATIISDGVVRNRRSHLPGPGIYAIAGEYELATTSLDDNDDKVILDALPARFHVLGGTVHVDDLDSATGLVWDLSTSTDLTGTVGTVLIADSTVGRSAGSDSLDETKVGTDVGGEYLMLHVNTAATTPVAGTYKWYIWGTEALDYQAHSSTVTSTRAGEPGEDLT